MTVKKIIMKLQLLMMQEFPPYDGKFYANHCSTYIHLGLDKLVISTKWKHDYIIRSRSC